MRQRLYLAGQFVLALGCAFALIGLLADVWFEVSSGYLSSDTLIFRTVGRGILNGLKPWSDLFETKPPGVFLLWAASLQLFGNQFLVKVVQGLVLLLIPFTVVMPAVRMAEASPAIVRRIVTLSSVLFGMLLALYAGNQAGFGLAESYGAPFAMLYVALVSGEWQVASGKWAVGSGKRTVLLGVLMLAAAGFKEPFVLSILAGVVLLAPSALFTSFKFSVFQFFIPACIAAVLGLIALYSLGWWDAFFGTYMPHMLGFHVFQHDAPLQVRALEIWRVFQNIGVVSWSLSFGITALWLSVPVIAIASGASRKDGIMFFVQWLIASYIAMLAIAAGGDFYGHHFIFALPLYLALFLKLESMALQAFTRRIVRVIVVLLILCFSFSALIDTRFSYGDAERAWQQQEAHMQSVAATVDAVMERCGYERYLQGVARGGGPYAYTKASPYGPIFIHYSRFIGASKAYQDAYLTALQETPLILMNDTEDSNLSEYALQYISERFTDTPPACAGEGFVQPKPYTLLFAQALRS